MKTVYTTLPIYKALKDQYFERGITNNFAGPKTFAPIYTPKHRLPSFQWIDGSDGATTVTNIYLVDQELALTEITTYFSTLPSLYSSSSGDDYFIYNGDTLNYALPEGSYYLKIVMDTNYIYYSDWFTVQCVYCHFAKNFINSIANPFDTFLPNTGTTITSCIDGGANAYADSTPLQSVYLGQSITVMLYLTETGVTNPSFSVVSTSLGIISNVETTVAGLNELTLITTRAADDVFIRIQTAGTTNFSTSEILVYTQYACGYVTLSFSNCCNLGDLLYENDFYQTLWIKSDNIEQAYPYIEKGQENGAGKFIPTFRRQDKTHIVRTGIVSQYMVDVLNRLKLHDVMTYVDQIGDAFYIDSVEVETEWLFEDKYYANVAITLNLGEAIVTEPCC